MKRAKRILAIDLARGISSFLIPAAHVFLIYATTYTQEEHLMGQIIHFFGKWAGIFLIAMGFSFKLSNRNSISSSIKRGIKLLLIGYLMNFLKFVIPGILGLFPENFITAYGWESPLNVSNYIYMVLTGDILQLAGFSLFFMGIIDKFTKNNRYILLVLAFLIISLLEFVRGTRSSIYLIDIVLDLLWGGDWNVYFAIFPWFSYILIGMFFSCWFKEKQKDQGFIFNKMLLFGVGALTIGLPLCLYNYEYHMRDYFHTGIGGFFYLLGFNLILFWLMYYISIKVTDIVELKFVKLLIYCSERITVMYVIQWVLIMLSIGVFGYHTLEPLQLIPIMVLFTVLTIIVQKIYDLAQDKLSSLFSEK